MKPSWTHIIVGAGAAGCVTAARLSENLEHRVLLIEEGLRSRDPLIRVPMATGLLLRGERHTRQFQTPPVAGLNQRSTRLPRGVVLGGSTAINGMIYLRGLASDYDAWARAGLADWSYEKVLPFFLRSERFIGPGGSAHFHGHDGELTVSRRSQPVSELANHFIEAGLASGHRGCDDFNAPNPEGFGFYHFSIRDGRRVTAADAFLAGAMLRPNLDLMCGCNVDRVNITNGKAMGVVVRTQSGQQILDCEGEVVLSAGVFGSPAILLRSGIGPADDLRKLGIPVTNDVADVGNNLHDHVLVRVRHQARSNSTATLHKLSRIDRAASAFLQAYLFGRGPMNVFPLETGAILRSVDADVPDLQANFIPALSSASLHLNPFRTGASDREAGYFASVSLMRPKSRGIFRLTSSDLHAMPLVQPNYLAEPDDVKGLVDGVEMMREVMAQAPLATHSRAELDPGVSVRSRQALTEFVRNTADTVHHAVGTCRMGIDAASVVDRELRVRNVEGLRVADASVFPAIPSTNTMAASYMVGERAADFINAEQDNSRTTDADADPDAL